MSSIKQCDRCGAYENLAETSGTTPWQRIVQFSYAREAQLDLCPRCASAFEFWIKETS